MSEEDVRMFSKKITNKDQCIDFGINVLKAKYLDMRSALYNHKNKADDAAFDILLRWCHQQSSASEAYAHLYTALKKSEMRLLATELWFSMDTTGRLHVESVISRIVFFNIAVICK